MRSFHNHSLKNTTGDNLDLIGLHQWFLIVLNS